MSDFTEADVDVTAQWLFDRLMVERGHSHQWEDVRPEQREDWQAGAKNLLAAVVPAMGLGGPTGALTKWASGFPRTPSNAVTVGRSDD
jgi:hypothetical protein